MEWTFEKVAGPMAGGLGGMCWTGKTLLVSAVGEGVIHSCEPESGALTEFRRYTNRTNGLGMDAAGNLYGCQEGSRRVIQFCDDGSAVTTEVMVDGRIHNHPNNLSIDRAGRIWFSDPHSDIPAPGPPLFPPLSWAAVLRLERDSRKEWGLKRMTYDSVEPRAVLVSADEKTLYVAEGTTRTPMRELRAYRILADGSLGTYTVLQSFAADSRGAHRGIEGMCLDAQGNIVACAGYSESGPGPVVMVISPAGVVLESHELPCDLPMSCCFGGTASLDVLYVTTGEGHLLRAKQTGRRGYDRFESKAIA
jgi:gluconolactonase